MPRRHELADRALSRPRLVVAVAITAFIAVAAAVAALASSLSSGTTMDDAQLGAGRIGQPSSTAVPVTTTSSAPTTVPSTTTSTTLAPTTTPAPTTAAPTTTAAPVAPPPPPPPPVAPAGPPIGERCLVRLHGKGGGGSSPSSSGGVLVLSPSGNASGWGGRQWLYFAPSSYESALGSVAAAIESSGCGQVIVNGFSNGGAFAVKLYCRGETFGGRLVGVVADDPVPDHGADGCSPPGGVPLTLYWTGALDAAAKPGWNCAEQDWTCDGGTTVGIAAYAANAGASVKTSPFGNHQWYMNAPEVHAWR